MGASTAKMRILGCTGTTTLPHCGKVGIRADAMDHAKLCTNT